MEFRVLGPVEADAGGRAVDLGRPQQRLVLAVLLAEAGRLVSTETLIDRVWDSAPDGARRTLHVHLTRLRQLLEQASASTRLVRRSGVYLLDVDPSRVDVHRFRRLVAHARDRKHSDADRALRALSGSLEQMDGPDGETLYDIPGAARPAGDTPAPPRLMAMWDSILLAYADRGRVIPPEHRKLVARSNGDVLPTLLVDGYVAGVWRPVDGGIEATAFHRLPAQAWKGLAAEAGALTGLLADREPRVYRRYDRWWAGLPAAQVRILQDGTTA